MQEHDVIKNEMWRCSGEILTRLFKERVGVNGWLTVDSYQQSIFLMIGSVNGYADMVYAMRTLDEELAWRLHHLKSALWEMMMESIDLRGKWNGY
jgi:hypothetical protein